MENFQGQVASEYRKNKEYVLQYQVVLYETLKRTKLFDKEGKASHEEKVMFREIVDLTEEKNQIDLKE